MGSNPTLSLGAGSSTVEHRMNNPKFSSAHLLFQIVRRGKMKSIFVHYLFAKGYLIGNEVSEHSFEYAFAMANMFGIRIVRGGEYASEDLLEFISNELGRRVPPSFYRGFPESVKKLSRTELLFDQLIHYTRTYGFGNFDSPDYSRFEEDFERCAFREEVTPRDFSILCEEEAKEVLLSFVEALLNASRPLSTEQYEVVLMYYREYGELPCAPKSKNTAIRLFVDTGVVDFCDALWLSDVIKVCAEIQYRKYGSEDLSDLHLKNGDRKMLTALIHKLMKDGKCNLAECYEKKKLFQGLLHHIHLKPESAQEEEFLLAMRGRGNGSVYATVERALKKGDVPFAVTALYEGKGGGAVLRELNYFVSRAEDKNDIRFILSHIDASPILYLQLYLSYASYAFEGSRVFRFTKFNRMRTHTETEEEVESRRSRLDKDTVAFLHGYFEEKLKEMLHGKVGKVYIDEEMYKIALPLAEASTQGGVGVLPRGSRLPLPEGKKIRAFTYWEKVNDIDLAVLGFTVDGKCSEFSWRTMWDRQSKGITFSGDQTSGFKGGSEYYDIVFDAFMKKYPDTAYLVFTNNVYSDMHFNQCICRAGYMMRDVEDSGQVFEPKTVESSFVIDADSTSAYLFGIDLGAREFVWLNVANHSEMHIAALQDATFLLEYFRITEHMNVGKFFEWMAQEVVDNPSEADIVLSTREVEHREDAEVIRRFEYEKMLKYLG